MGGVKYRRWFGNKVGKSWLTRGRGIEGEGRLAIHGTRSEVQISAASDTKDRAVKGLGKFSELKRIPTKIFSTHDFQERTSKQGRGKSRVQLVLSQHPLQGESPRKQ